MKKLSVVWMALPLMIAYSAFAQDVRYNFDKTTDFSKFKTYKWVVIKDAAPVNDLVDKKIKNSVDTQLATKGLGKVDGDNADLFIAYQAAVGTEKQFTSFSSGMGPGWGAGPGWWRGWYGAGGMRCDHNRADHNDLCRPARSRYVRLGEQRSRLARSREQDNRPEGKARQTAKESR